MSRGCLAGVLVTATCGGEAPTTPPPVAPPQLVAVKVSPRFPVVQVHDSVAFSATVHRADGQDVALPVYWIASAGNITPAGGYTPPDSVGDYKIIAAVMGQNLIDTVHVTVVPDTTHTPPDSTGAPVDTTQTPPPPDSTSTPPPDSTGTPPPQPPDSTAPPPFPSGPYPNEPAGMTPLTQRSFDQRVENGWSDRGDNGFSIVADPIAPVSAPNVGQALFQPRMSCGVAPMNTWSPKFQDGIRKLYLSFWLEMDPNWYGNVASVNKVLFIHIANGPRVVVNTTGVGVGRLAMEMRVQGMGVPKPAMPIAKVSWNAPANLNGGAATIARGHWVHEEVLLIANTPGLLDGQIHFWLNGIKVGQYSDVGFSSASETGDLNTWQLAKWNPTYGGGCNGPHAKTNGRDEPLGDQFPVPQWQRMDEMYISGAP